MKIAYTATGTAYTRPQMGTAEPRYMANVTLTSATSIASQNAQANVLSLSGGNANGTAFLPDENVVELRWDSKDANAWEATLVLLPAALVYSTGSNPALQVNIFNTSTASVTPADHQFVLAIW